MRRNFWSWLPSPRLAFAVTSLVVMSVWLSSTQRGVSNHATVATDTSSTEQSQAASESDFRMIQNLPVLENYDVLSKFDALSELPTSPGTAPEEGTKKPDKSGMKLRFQFGALLAAFLAVALAYSPAFGQGFREIAQTPAQQRRAARQLRRQQRQQLLNPSAPNAMRPGVPGNNLPPRAIERLQDMPPERQEKFLQNNQRFQNLPPEQQAQIRQRLQAWNRLTPSQQQDLRERQQVWEQMTPEQQREVAPELTSTLATIASAAPPGNNAEIAFASGS